MTVKEEEMKKMLQKDRRWENLEIVPKVTVGKEGCLITCLCMANTLLGNPLTPSSLVAELQRAGGFTKEGLLIWAKLQNTSSRIWLCMGKDACIPNLKIVEYKNSQGKSHFVLFWKGKEFDPNPRTKRFGIISERKLAYIHKG